MMGAKVRDKLSASKRAKVNYDLASPKGVQPH
jgi:hypothetical protein